MRLVKYAVVFLVLLGVSVVPVIAQDSLEQRLEDSRQLLAELSVGWNTGTRLYTDLKLAVGRNESPAVLSSKAQQLYDHWQTLKPWQHKLGKLVTDLYTAEIAAKVERNGKLEHTDQSKRWKLLREKLGDKVASIYESKPDHYAVETLVERVTKEWKFFSGRNLRPRFLFIQYSYGTQ